jgi:hypothetical protein
MERYENNSSIHPDINPNLWLEGGLFGGLDRNLVYRLSSTMTENLCTTRSILTIGFLQSVPSTKTPEFGVILDQQTQD